VIRAPSSSSNASSPCSRSTATSWQIQIYDAIGVEACFSPAFGSYSETCPPRAGAPNSKRNTGCKVGLSIRSEPRVAVILGSSRIGKMRSFHFIMNSGIVYTADIYHVGCVPSGRHCTTNSLLTHTPRYPVRVIWVMRKPTVLYIIEYRAEDKAIDISIKVGTSV
jgi:hypothetical protein